MERSDWLREKRRLCEERMDTLFAPVYDERWGGYINSTHRRMLQTLLTLCPAGGRVLDAACGTGKYWPMMVWSRDKCKRYLRHGKPIHRPELVHNTAYSIVAQFQSEYRGIVEYYRLAYNLHQLNRLKWVMERSLSQTLAHKLRISVKQAHRRYQATVHTDQGPRVGLQVRVEREEGKQPLVATWGGITLARQMKAVLNDQPPRFWGGRTELEKRLLADTCELCGSQEDIQVHHVRALKDLRQKGRVECSTPIRITGAWPHGRSNFD